MALIEQTADRSHGATQKVAKQLADVSETLEIVPTEEVAPKPSSYLARLRHIHRRPPALPLSAEGSVQTDPMQAVIALEIAHLANTKVPDFAFAVAELAWRLEKPIASSDNSALAEGHALLSQTARMYEHLFLLETGSEA